jgi:hypothetical protein
MKLSFNGDAIPDTDRIKYLSLVASEPKGLQKKILTSGKNEEDDSKRQAMMMPTISVFPDDKNFNQTFRVNGGQFSYTGEAFLTPENLPNHSSKFVSVLNSIDTSRGVCLVNSNYVDRGARLFAMALEEHGYTPYKGNTLLKDPSYEGTSKGKYILISSTATDAEISSMLDAVKNRSNSTGKNIKVVVTSPLAAEGIDFRFVRQVHILDPWWNMSRIEQVIGRALRTCSHQSLMPEEQNCTVYLHVVRPEAEREAFDEYTYRKRVEIKGVRIAKVRKILAESAMDCPIQLALPSDWRELEVPQIRDEGHERVAYRLKGMMAPAFDEAPDIEQCKITPSEPDPDHVRPLSSYLDSRDEILTQVGKLLIDKSIWDREQLFSALRPFSREVVIYTLQQAISTAFRFADAFGRPSLLESKGDLYALAPIDVPNSTLIERTTKPPVRVEVPLPEPVVEETPTEVAPDLLDTRRTAFKWPKDAATRFSEDIKNSYILDHEFTPAEKKAYLATKPDVPFVSRLYVPDSDIVVSGDETDLVGEDLTKYNEWSKELIERFVGDKGKLFASVGTNGVVSLSPSKVVESVITRTIGEKSFMPTACATGQNSVTYMRVVAKYIDVNEVGFPEGLSGGPLCTYFELLAREEHNVSWYTPEEMKVLGSSTNKTSLMKKLKA